MLFEIAPTISWEDRLCWEEVEQNGRRITLIGL